MIKISGLQYRIESRQILEDINVEIGDGEFTAIIGPNGAGKSTLLKLLLGLLDMQQGSITIDKLPHTKWLKTNSFGYLPQHEGIDRSFPATALDLAMMGLAGSVPPLTRFSKQDRNQGLAALEQTGVGHLAGQMIGRLSGGEFQRVLLARAIVSNSRYIVLDEPEANLDLPSVRSFFQVLKSLNESGCTIITVSHDLHTLSDYCSFLICLNRRLHCHNHTELIDSEMIHKTFGDSMRIIEKGY